MFDHINNLDDLLVAIGAIDDNNLGDDWFTLPNFGREPEHCCDRTLVVSWDDDRVLIDESDGQGFRIRPRRDLEDPTALV